MLVARSNAGQIAPRSFTLYTFIVGAMTVGMMTVLLLHQTPMMSKHKLLARFAVALSLVFVAIGLTSCEEALDGPRIARFGLAPDTVSASQNCGMSDQHFEAEAVIRGADSPLEGGQLELLDTPQGERPAGAAVSVIQDASQWQFNILNYSGSSDESALAFSDIQQSWCQQLEPGAYDVKVTASLENGTEISKTFFGELTVNQ